MARLDGRANDELRPVMIIPNVNEFAEGSVMVKCGKTHVNITASVEERVPICSSLVRAAARSDAVSA